MCELSEIETTAIRSLSLKELCKLHKQVTKELIYITKCATMDIESLSDIIDSTTLAKYHHTCAREKEARERLGSILQACVTEFNRRKC